MDKVKKACRSVHIFDYVMEQDHRFNTQIKDVAQAFKTQNTDIWPTYNIRLISATTPRGNRAIIGQESTVKYYSNSKRTHLIKKIHHTMWVG